MSGSPKYTRVRLRRQIDLGLRAARVASAAAARASQEAEQQRRRVVRDAAVALARAARKAEEERRRTAKVEDARTDVNAHLAALRPRLAVENTILRSEMNALERRLRDAYSVDEVRMVRLSVREFENQVAQLETASRVARHAADLSDAEAYLDKLRKRTGNLDQAVSDRLVPGERTQIDGLLASAADALAQRAPAKCVHLLRQADDRIAAHESSLYAATTQEQEDQTHCRAALDEVMDRLGGLRFDAVVSRWCQAEIARIAHSLSLAEDALRVRRYGDVTITASELTRVADDLMQRAMEIQLEEDRRQYVVNGIVQALGQLGFVVQKGSPALEHPGVQSSSVIIQARRVGGGAVAVSIPQHGDIWYDVDGYPKRSEGTRDGQVLASCDEAEAQLTRLHEVINSEFGIETDGLHWHGKDPERLRKQADQLPGSGTADSKPGGKA